MNDEKLIERMPEIAGNLSLTDKVLILKCRLYYLENESQYISYQ